MPTQTSLETEKQKSDEVERKYNEVLVSHEERGKKLEDTDKKVRQLQESLTRWFKYFWTINPDVIVSLLIKD